MSPEFIVYNSLEPSAILRPEHDFNSVFAHPDIESDPTQNWIQKFVTEH